jgi:LysR family transcriptional regulator, nitrogen assimilation regulatory protein
VEIKQLHNFCAVADAGSLTAAARTLGVTQAALSRQLAMLEAELEVSLFRRTGRGLLVTAEGSRLLKHAQHILQIAAQIPLAVRGSSMSGRATLALGLPPSLARTIVLPLVEACQAELPQAVMRTVDGLSADLLEFVAEGKLDCAIVYNTAGSDLVELTPLMEESLYLVSGAFEGPPLGTSVTLNEVATLPLISAGNENAVHQVLCSGLARVGQTPLVVHEIANLTAILDLVRKGYGYSVIPLSGVHSCVGDEHLKLHRLRRPSLQIPLFIAQPFKAEDPLTTRELSLVRRVLLDQLKNFDQEVEAAISTSSR